LVGGLGFGVTCVEPEPVLVLVDGLLGALDYEVVVCVVVAGREPVRVVECVLAEGAHCDGVVGAGAVRDDDSEEQSARAARRDRCGGGGGVAGSERAPLHRGAAGGVQDVGAWAAADGEPAAAHHDRAGGAEEGAGAAGGRAGERRAGGGVGAHGAGCAGALAHERGPGRPAAPAHDAGGQFGGRSRPEGEEEGYITKLLSETPSQVDSKYLVGAGGTH
jgi:hypothetical protein